MGGAAVLSVDELAEVAAEALAAEAARIEGEQSPYGIDRLLEVDLHPALAAGFAGAGWAVFREGLYPGQSGGERKRGVKDSARERCDLVLAEAGATRIRDDVEVGRRIAAAEDGLFAAVAAREEPERAAGVDPGDAMWVEVEVVGQHCYEAGVPGPNRTYAGELLAAGRDAKKLGKARGLVHGAVMLVLFAADEVVARHDLGAALHRWMDRDWPVSQAAIEVRPIVDRIGNGVLAVMVVRVRCGGG